MYTQSEKKYMLGLARRAIENYFKTGGALAVGQNELPSEALAEKRSCFVTLRIAGRLRGCIGHLEAVQPLYADIIDNAVSAAFGDYRFPRLSESEFKNTDIEVSVLKEPRPLAFSSPEDLLEKLRPDADGVILKKGRRGATYLPQVWKDLPDKGLFLSSLCEKAGLAPDEWKKPGIVIETYEVEVIG